MGDSFHSWFEANKRAWPAVGEAPPPGWADWRVFILGALVEYLIGERIDVESVHWGGHLTEAAQKIGRA